MADFVQWLVAPEFHRLCRTQCFIILFDATPRINGKFREFGGPFDMQLGRTILYPCLESLTFHFKKVDEDFTLSDDPITSDLILDIQFYPQNACKLPSITLLDGWSESPAQITAFVLPIFDRLIMSKQLPYYHPHSATETIMRVPVNNLYWDFQLWNIREIFLSNHNERIKMQVGDTYYILRDSDLERIFY